MDVANFLSETSFWLPEHLCEPFSWVGHIPFAFWLVGACRPGLLVELGTHSGNSYLAFCQAAAPYAPATRCHAIDTWQGDDYTGHYHESVFERVQKINQEFYSGFSYLIRSTFEAAVQAYSDGSIDLLHIDGNHDYEAVRDDFDTWLPKLSDRGIVLFHDTNVHDSPFGVYRLFDEIKERFPTFEFLHSHGLGMALVGPHAPEPVLRLVQAARDERVRHLIQDVYARLGASLEQNRVRKDLENLNHLLGSQLSSTMDDLIKAAGDLSANAREIGELRAVLHDVGEHARRLELENNDQRREKELLAHSNQELDRRRQELERSNLELIQRRLELERSNVELGQRWDALERHTKEVEQIAQLILQERTALSQTNQALQGQIDSLRTSASWALVQRLQRLRSLAGENTLRGRLLRGSFRRIKMVIAGGADLYRLVNRPWRRQPSVPPAYGEVSAAGSETCDVEAGAGRSLGFHDLPWEWSGAGPVPRLRNDRFQLLLVSHEASRSGAPLLLRRLAEELARRDDMQCWIVLAKGGEIEDSFDSIAPTLKADVLSRHGVPPDHVPTTVGSLFRSAMSQGLVLCSSSALGAYFTAFQHLKLPVLAWVHELSTVIEILGGPPLIQSISRTARRIIVPTHQVRQSLINAYQLNPDQIATIHYGVDMPGADLDTAAARKKIRKELGLPADALIVLGCGAVEARKGCDLFVQLARTVLHEVESRRLASPAYFVWIGRDNDPNFRVWLDHDIRRSGLEKQVLFAGQRRDPDAFFMGADVFVLPSREETFSLVTVEAMVRGVPALAFRDAGGAAEVLEGCGQTVPYLDVVMMAHAVSRLLLDAEFRREQGQLARAFNCDRFSWTGFTSLLIPILEEHYGFTGNHSAKSSERGSSAQPREKRWRPSVQSGLARAVPERAKDEMRSDRIQSSTNV